LASPIEGTLAGSPAASNHVFEGLERTDRQLLAGRFRSEPNLRSIGGIAAFSLWLRIHILDGDLAQAGNRELARATLFQLPLDFSVQAVKDGSDVFLGQLGGFRDIGNDLCFRKSLGGNLCHLHYLSKSAMTGKAAHGDQRGHTANAASGS